MLHLVEYHPPFLAFAEVHHAFVDGQLELAELRPAAQAFAQFLEQLQQRLNWELPLLHGFSEASGAISLLCEPLQNLALRLKHQPQDPAVLSQLQGCLTALYRVQCFFEQLPAFTDVAVVNELLVLGARSGEVDPLPIRQRIPALLDWIGSLEASWEVFLQLYPQRRSLVDKAMTVVKALQGAAGALHLFVEGEDPAALQPGLRLLVNALEALAPLEETRYLEETQMPGWSPDLRLERAARLLKETGEIPLSYQTCLRKWVAEKFRALLATQGWNQLSGTLPKEELEQLQQGLTRCSRRVEKWDCDQRELLEQLEDWRRQFEQAAQSLAATPVSSSS